MKHLKAKFLFFTFLLMVVLIQKSLGQESEKSKFGLGVTLFNLTDYSYDNTPANSILMTFDLDNNFRIEPSIGFALSNGYNKYSLGVGLFNKKPISNFNFLYGIRLGLYSGSIIGVAPTVGGEYYFIKNFSVGSEVQLKALMKSGDWALLTNSSVLVRIYF